MTGETNRRAVLKPPADRGRVFFTFALGDIDVDIMQVSGYPLRNFDSRGLAGSITSTLINIFTALKPDADPVETVVTDAVAITKRLSPNAVDILPADLVFVGGGEVRPNALRDAEMRADTVSRDV